MAVKYYAVRKGIKPGIYKDWNPCRRQRRILKKMQKQRRLEKNRKFMHLSMVHLTRRHMYTVMADFLSMMALKKYCRVPAKMRTWLP